MTTGTKRRTTNSPSALTEKKIEALEEGQKALVDVVTKISNNLDDIAAKQKEISVQLAQPQKLPRVQDPDDRIKAMKQAKLGEGVSEMRRSVDLNHPNASKNALQPGTIIRLRETCEKYAAYSLDEQDEPVKAIFSYQCQACPESSEYLRGPDKKICPKCGNTMIKHATGTYKPGTPAYGVILNYMYTNRKGVKKYKVHFEKFSDKQRTEGLLETEFVVCQ